MLQDIRKNSQGTAAKVIIGLIVISFAGFGLQSILLDGGGGTIGEVNGEAITPSEFNQTLNTQQRRLAAQMGDNFDPNMLEPERLKPQIIESLVTRKLLRQSAQEHGLTVSERAIGKLIGQMDQFQVDGKFSPEAYRAALGNAGYEPVYFKQSLREDMVLNQMRSGLSGSEFVTPAEINLTAQIVLEQRDIRYLTIPQEKFAETADVTGPEIEAYYASNQERFLTPESVDLDYIELAAIDFVEAVEESVLQEAYELEKDDPRYQTQNRVSHILFAEDSKLGLDIPSRLAQAQVLLAEGLPFSEVAKTASDDAGSASVGGDLGFSAGDAFPEEMEAALAELAVDEVSGPVVTDAGTHLLLVTERNAAVPPSFAELRPKLEERLALEEARVTLLRTVESLRDLSFNADDLNRPAEELSLEVKQEQGVARTQSSGLFAKPALLSEAFSEDVLQAGHNSAVIEVATDQYVVLRVRTHHEPEVQQIDTVKDAIVASIQRESAANALRQEAEALLAELREGQSIEALAAAHDYQWQVELGVDRRAATLPPEVLQRVFDLPAPKNEGTANALVLAGNGDAIVLELARVTPGSFESLPEAQQKQLSQEVGRQFGGLLDAQYLRRLRDAAQINVL